MPFSVAVMMSVGICGRGGRCGADDMVEGLEDGGGGGEAEARRWVEALCSVVVVGAVGVSTGFDGKAEFPVSMSIHHSPSLDSYIGRDMLSMYIPSLPESTCWLLLPLFFSPKLLNRSRRLNSQFILYDGSESRCSVPDFLTNMIGLDIGYKLNRTW